VLSAPPVAPPPGTGDASKPALGYVQGYGTYGHYQIKQKADLSEFLPAPQQQKGNTCFAWAAGYASYTCQINQERHQAHPEKPWQTFSAAFIASHIPGSDDGVSAEEVYDCLSTNGCASMAAVRESDRIAEKEGRLYRAVDHGRAENLEHIKIYLSQGYPVVLVIQRDDNFNNKTRSDVPYTWSGGSDRPAYHAICAVGFDTQKHTVRVMNSDGSDWKDGGFCDVDESILQTIRHDSWCVEAHVFKVKKSLPLEVEDLTQVTYTEQDWLLPSMQLQLDHVIYEDDKAISPAGWRFDDLAWPKSRIFGLRDNFKVYRHVKNSDWISVTAGLNESEYVTMIAGAGEQRLHALTQTGELYALGAMDIWDRVQLPESPRVVDLRTVEDRTYAVTDTGRVFQTENDGTWSEQTEP